MTDVALYWSVDDLRLVAKEVYNSQESKQAFADRLGLNIRTIQLALSAEGEEQLDTVKRILSEGGGYTTQGPYHILKKGD